MTDFKDEYEILKAEVDQNKKLYVTLQQSLIFLKTKKFNEFYITTYESLKKLLLQEIKISDYKTRLFYRLMLNSQSKQFSSKSSNCIDNNFYDIFKDVNFQDNNLNLDENINFINFDYNGVRNNNEDKINEFLGNYATIKDNLFMTKSKNLNCIFLFSFFKY